MLVNQRKNREHEKRTITNISLFKNTKVNTPSQSKSYYTSRQEKDDCSICPSIEKELHQSSQPCSDNLHEISIQKLIEQSKLKNKALQKASSMIKLLEEENQQLQSQVGYLQTVLKDRERQIQLLQQEVRQLKPNSSTFIRDLISDKDNKRQNQNTINITNDFYSFAQQRQSSILVRKSQSKIVNNDHPSYKQANQLQMSISKKLTPYSSRNHIDTDSVNINSILTNLSMLLIQEGVGNSRIVMQEINELIAMEQQEQEQLLLQLELQQQQVNLQCELPHSPESSQVSRRLFTLQNKTTPKYEVQTLSVLIDNYQTCIQGYKEYAAYLRAHLCECINFISQKLISKSSFEVPWPHGFIKHTAKDIGRQLKQKIRDLQEQNWELKKIMEELIKNFEMAQYSTNFERRKSQ